MMRSARQKASAAAYKESLKRPGPLTPNPEPPRESWWLRPDFYDEARKQRERQRGLTGGVMKLPF